MKEEKSSEKKEESQKETAIDKDVSKTIISDMDAS